MENYANSWRRLIAFLWDWIFILIANSILSILLIFILSFFQVDLLTQNFLFLPFVLFCVMALLYSSIMEASKYQATLGEIMLGLKITDLKGERISLAKSFFRSLLKPFSFILNFILIGTFVQWLSPKKQYLHDLATGTLVLVKKPISAVSMILFLLPALFFIIVILSLIFGLISELFHVFMYL